MKAGIVVVVVLMVFLISGAGMCALEEYEFVDMWPKLEQPWYFYQLADVVLDSTDHVYVIDSNGLVLKFTAEGKSVTKWMAGAAASKIFPSRDDKNDDARTHHGEMTVDYAIAVDSEGNVYVGSWARRFDYTIAMDSKGNEYVDTSVRNNCKIKKFAADGRFVVEWGEFGRKDGQFVCLSGLAIDSSDNIYAVDISRVQKFDQRGKLLKKWYLSDNNGKSLNESETYRKDSVNAAGNDVAIGPSVRYMSSTASISKYIDIHRVVNGCLVGISRLMMKLILNR